MWLQENFCSNVTERFIETWYAFLKLIMELMTPDYKSGKIIASFSLSFLIVSSVVILLAFVLVWNPAIWHTKYWRKVHDLDVKEISPISKEPLVLDYKESLKVYPNGINFLPELTDLIVKDDLEVGNVLPQIQEKAPRENVENDSEALTSLKMAVHMKKLQKVEKAQKLFQHALTLCPSHPDILNHYGEFVEEHNEDIIKADYLYQRALTICPKHSRALTNSKRTVPVVNAIDQKQLARIDLKRMRLMEILPNDPSFKRMKKEAYFQHIHHTVAIEGNTMTLAETRSIVETGLAVPGKSILEHNEILGMEAALRYLNNTLVNKISSISVEDILNIHRRVLGNVDPIQAGSFRKTQVYVGEHTPPAASDVYNLMEDFVEWLGSEHVLKMHTVRLSALAHYKLVYIHPFVDGNGRTARLLMNLILMRAGYPPVIIRKQDRGLYYKYLQVANDGDVRPFVRFIAESTEGTLDVYLYATEYGISEVKALEAKSTEYDKVIEY